MLLVLGAAAIVAAPGLARAQAPAADPPSGGPAEKVIEPDKATLRPSLRFQILDRDDGLPQNGVRSMAQDRTGFMWLGTEDGLARWDGQRFRVFRHDPTSRTSLGSNTVLALLVSKDGTLWVGTEGGGVNRYRSANGTFDRFVASDAADTLKSNSIRSLGEGPDGRIWIATYDAGVSVLDPATGKVSTYSTEDGLYHSVPTILVDPDGTVWAGTGSGLYRLEPKKTSFEPTFQDVAELADATITALTRDKEGNLWIGTDEAGLVKMPKGGGKLVRFQPEPDNPERLSDKSVKSIYPDRRGRIWVGTKDFVHLLDPASGKFERYPVEPEDPRSLPDSPNGFLEDAAGVLWVGTFNKGAALLDPRATIFRTYKTGATVSAFFRKGPDLWVNTVGGLCRWRGKVTLEGVCYKTGRAIPVFIDKPGNLWVGTWEDGILRLPPGGKERWVHYKNADDQPGSPAAGVPTYIHEDRNGTLWFGYFGGGLQRYDRAKDRFVTVELQTNNVYMIKDDPSEAGVLWIATADQGIIRYNLETGIVSPFRPAAEDGKPDNSVVDFLFDDQAIWLATYGGGLKRLERRTLKEFKTYGRREGMPSDTIYALRPDKAGNLWVSTTGGLVRFDPRTGAGSVFGVADGLQADEFTQAAGIDTDDGRLVFGGIKGFSVFRPEEIEIDKFPPPLVVTSIEVLGDPYQTDRPYDQVRSLSLDYDEAFVLVQFAALSFSASERLIFEYQIEGVSDRWVRSDSTVNLAGLDDGDYTVHMRARNRHGVASKEISLAIAVAPPLWRTWWAYTAYGTILLGIIFGIYRYQQTRIDRLQKLARLAAVEKEFEITAAVQTWFLPEASRYYNGICELVGFYRGAEKCSGDWWWYEDLGGGRLWVIVADVTGHGAGPAMVTAAVAMGLSVQSEAGESVNDRLARVNREVLLRCKGKATMTMTALVLDQNQGHVTVYNLGGLPALRIGADGRHVVIGASGTPIGSVENLEIGERTTTLGPGERLLITTDGIIETHMKGGRPLGFRRFVNVVRDVRGMPLDQAVARIVTDVDMGRAAHPQEDDFTFCVIERRG